MKLRTNGYEGPWRYYKRETSSSFAFCDSVIKREIDSLAVFFISPHANVSVLLAIAIN